MAGKDQGSSWTPYGHERARRALLNTRRAQIVLAAIAIAIAYAFFLQLTLTEEGRQSDTIDVPEREPVKPVTVTVSPGRMAEFVDGQQEAPDARATPRASREAQNPIVEKVKPFLSLLAPLVAALWLLSRVGTSARGRLAELNLGVYKGAMPYEMHTARAYKKIFTYRQVDAHVFGKAREEFLFGSYLEEPPLAVRRLLGEPLESADVTRLRRGGARRVTVTAPAPMGKPLDRLVAPLREWVGRRTARDPRADRLRRLRRQQRRAGRT